MTVSSSVPSLRFYSRSFSPSNRLQLISLLMIKLSQTVSVGTPDLAQKRAVVTCHLADSPVQLPRRSGTADRPPGTPAMSLQLLPCPPENHFPSSKHLHLFYM